jgi:phospholipase/carboxylesterase
VSSRVEPRRIQYGPLNAIEFAGEGPTIVCLHGYGADAADLASLANEIQVPGRWLFPEAPLALDGGPMISSRAWFPIPEEAFEGMNMGRPLDLATQRPPGLDSAADQLAAFLDAAGGTYAETFLGGFSQGSMVSLEVVLRQAQSPAGLFILSGTLVDRAATSDRLQGREPVKIMQSHGEQDAVLPFSGAQALHQLLTEKGAFSGELLSFPGGHELPLEALSRLRKFLQG